MDEWAAEHHLWAEREALVGEVARVGEAMVLLDAGGTGDVAALQAGADVMAGLAVLQPGADVMAGLAVLQLGAEAMAGVAVVRRLVAEPHAAAVVQAGLLALLAVDVAVSLFHVRPVAAQGEVPEPARLRSSSWKRHAQCIHARVVFPGRGVSARRVRDAVAG